MIYSYIYNYILCHTEKLLYEISIRVLKDFFSLICIYICNFWSIADEARKEIRKLMFTRCEKMEINLRKYRLLGGVLHIDLVYQPPQPKDMKKDIMLTTCER